MDYKSKADQPGYLDNPRINPCEPQDYAQQKRVKYANSHKEVERENRVTSGWWRSVCYYVARNKTEGPGEQHYDSKRKP